MSTAGFVVFGRDQLNTLRSELEQHLVARFGDPEGQHLGDDLKSELERCLATLPYIGSPGENRWAVNMAPTALALAAHRVLVPRLASTEDVGQMFFDAVKKQTRGLSAFVMKAMHNEGGAVEAARKLAERSQRRQYQHDWVISFVEPDGEDFTYGLDVIECAITKYLGSEGAPGLARYLCLTDFLTSEATSRGLVRTMTLAGGCDRCDFRYKQGRPTHLSELRDGWPPKFDGCKGG